ncbi:cytochrome P450 2J2 isoform X2 [Capricornis sumatraensis]|uniref:cytochrome P450 2J2 isoform X2 n=1 Tax=Capricornis sumatraensis TaxID=34865 RepID=UPI003604A4F1
MLEALGSLAAAFWTALRPGTVLLGTVVFLLLSDLLKRQRPKNYPPGPPRLPFVGNFFQLDFEQGHLSLQRFVKKYGNLFSLELGDLPSVVITGLPLIKEVLVHQDQNFVNRPITPIRERVFKENGLIMSNGHIWKEQRRFSLTALRNFGLGRKSLEEHIQEEVAFLIQAIGEKNGQPFNPHFKINNAVSNIICSIAFGERFDYQDDQFQELLRLLDEVTYLETTLWCQLYNVFPRIMNFLPGPHQRLFSNWEKLKMFVARMIENHKRDWNPAEARDFIDAYLQETEKDEAPCVVATKNHLNKSIITVLSSIRAMLLQVSMKKTLSTAPWTSSLLEQRQRQPPCAGVCSTWPCTLKSKGTMVLTNLTALHRDPAEWATPNTFNPEHFLENGRFKKREAFLPFSIGKRMCLGEQLARTELFIFFTSLLQKFTFRPPDNEELSLAFRMGLTLSPVSHRLCAVPRA